MSFVTGHLGLLFLIINTILSFIIVFRERKDTVNTWAVSYTHLTLPTN